MKLKKVIISMIAAMFMTMSFFSAEDFSDSFIKYSSPKRAAYAHLEKPAFLFCKGVKSLYSFKVFIYITAPRYSLTNNARKAFCTPAKAFQ